MFVCADYANIVKTLIIIKIVKCLCVQIMLCVEKLCGLHHFD